MSGTLVLDCEGRFKLVRRTPELTEWLAAAKAEDIRVITSSVTLVQAREPVTNQARFDYAVSRVKIVPPTEAIARHACEQAARMHGYKYALDTVVAATALASPVPVTVLTSAPQNLHMPRGPRIGVIKV
ncbi:type II toxin-antitoxin system VapC family toxin [Streptomyces sp. NPDC055025]